jgi:plasmid stabilization system protein ParE
VRAEFTRGARAELRAAARYFEDQRRGLGNAFQTDIRRTVQLIVANPEIGAPVTGLPRHVAARQFLANVFPYYVVYGVESERILVIAVANTSREPLYWVGR